MAEVLSNLAANTVVSSAVSAEEKSLLAKNRMTFPTPLQLLQNAPYSVPMEAMKAPAAPAVPAAALDLHSSTKSIIQSQKHYLDCLERNPMVHGYTKLISTLYNMYEKQIQVVAQNLPPREQPLKNDDQYQSFLEQVRSKEKEMMYAGAKMFY